MATEKQIAANRRNAQRSTGPRTPTGKARSSRNALKHGILSRELIEEGESVEELAELIEALRADLRPEGEVEAALVNRIADCIWRLLRCHEWEFDLMYTHMNDYVVLAQHYRQELHMEWLPGQAFSMATNWWALAFRRLACHEKAIEGRFYGAIKELERLQAARASRADGPDGPLGEEERDGKRQG